MEMGTLIFDIDGTICTQEKDYSRAKPIESVIEKINQKYDEGYHITFMTARGSETGIDWTQETINQLKKWQVKYHDLYFGKPAGLKYIDDKGVNVYQWEPKIECQAVVDKIWGKEYLLTKNDNYSFKRLEIKKNKNLSKQYHNQKHETWHVIGGIGTAVIDGKEYNVSPGMTFIIPPKTIHQVRADSDLLEIIEASTSELNDIIRLEREWIY